METPEWMTWEVVERTPVTRGSTLVFQFGRQPVGLKREGDLFVKDTDELGSGFALSGTDLGMRSLTVGELASIPVHREFKDDDDEI
jgi:hypothetical protein